MKPRNAYTEPAKHRKNAGAMLHKRPPRRLAVITAIEEEECQFKHLSHNTYCTNCGMCDVECGVA